jgi:hypothetical protein
MWQFILDTVVFIACILYISKRWNEAKNKRNSDWITRPTAGIGSDADKPAVFWYLFK